MSSSPATQPLELKVIQQTTAQVIATKAAHHIAAAQAMIEDAIDARLRRVTDADAAAAVAAALPLLRHSRELLESLQLPVRHAHDFPSTATGQIAGGPKIRGGQ